jgi:O-antigen/teichoic acid export membrane protein
MMGRSSAVFRVSKNAGALMLGTLVRMAFAFAFVVYAARYLGIADYGKYALAVHLFELSMSLCATGFCILITREAAKNAAWLSRNLAPAIVLIVLLSLSAAALLAVVARLADYAPDTQLAIYMASAAILPGALCLMAEAIFVAFEKAEIVAAGIAAEAVLRTALCFAALLMGYGVLSLFVVLFITRCCQLGFYAALLLRRMPPVRRRIRVTGLWRLALEWRVFAAETWLATIYVSLDVLILSLFFGEAAVGLYDAAWKLIRLGPVVAQSFTTAIFPYIARLYVDARDSFQQVSEQSVKYILALVLPVVLCISIYAERIVVFLFDREYAGSGPVLQILAWLLVPQFLNPFLSRVLYARGQQRRSLAVAVVGLASFLSVAFVLIPRFGAVGAAWSAVISYYAALVCYIAFCTAGLDRRTMLTIFLRQAAAAAVLCLVLILMRHTRLFSVMSVCAVIYSGLLVVLGIITTRDFKLLQELR